MFVRDEFSLKARVLALLSIDLRSLAAMRCLGALTMLWCLIVWAPDLTLFFTDDGVLHRADFAGRFDWARFSILQYVDGYAFVLGLWLIGLFAAIALLTGYRSRAAALICWLVYLNFAGRNPMILQGGDILLPVLLFWMIFLPIGAVLSIDAALDSVDRRGESHLSIATVGVLLQVLYVYVFGALLKTGAAWVPDGSAIYIGLHIDSFVTPMGLLLRDHLTLMQLLTFSVYYLEFLTPILLFFPDKRQFVRMASLGALWLMHLGFRTFLHIGHFWLASLTSLCAYIPSRVWNWMGCWYFSDAQRTMRIYYDRDCGFCLKTALILREFFLPRTVLVTPAQDDLMIGEVLEREVSWVVIDKTGVQRLRWDAVVYVTSQSLILRPLGWLAWLYGAIGLGDPTYKLIGNSRKGIGAFTSRMLTPVQAIPLLSWPTKTLLATVIAFCFLYNLQGLGGALQPFSETSSIKHAAQKAGFTQHWKMFAPTPPTHDGFPIFEARNDAGVRLDIFPDPPRALSFDTPGDVVGLFDSARQRAFVLQAWIMGGDDRMMYMSRFARHRCAVVNQDGGYGKITFIKIHYLENQTKSNFQEEVRLHPVADVACDP